MCVSLHLNIVQPSEKKDSYLVASASPASVKTSTTEWSTKMLSWMLWELLWKLMAPPVLLVLPDTLKVMLAASKSVG